MSPRAQAPLSGARGRGVIWSAGTSRVPSPVISSSRRHAARAWPAAGPAAASDPATSNSVIVSSAAKASIAGDSGRAPSPAPIASTAATAPAVAKSVPSRPALRGRTSAGAAHRWRGSARPVRRAHAGRRRRWRSPSAHQAPPPAGPGPLPARGPGFPRLAGPAGRRPGRRRAPRPGRRPVATANAGRMSASTARLDAPTIAADHRRHRDGEDDTVEGVDVRLDPVQEVAAVEPAKLPGRHPRRRREHPGP